jgi:hypothetical protein
VGVERWCQAEAVPQQTDFIDGRWAAPRRLRRSDEIEQLLVRLRLLL